ncbi:MAG TPA: tyrosine-type recombinase/integrase, partial [Polyangia bacterium]
MEKAIAVFRQFLTTEKRASEHTVRAYLHDLGEVRAFACAALGHEPALRELDVILCRSYLASLHGRNDAVTIGRKLSSLRAFFRLAVRRRLCSGSPVAALRAPKRAKRLPAFLGKDDVGRLLEGGAPPAGAGVCAPALERALFEVIYGAGLRVSEACQLDVGDVEADGAGGFVRVRQGKGRKDRIVPIGSKARQALDVYAQHRPLRLTGTVAGLQALFLTR